MEKKLNEKKVTKRYIKQPYKITTLRGEMKLNQVRVLVEFMDILGNKIDDLLSGKIGTLDLFNSFDKNEYNKYVIDIPLNQLAEHSYQYKDIENIAHSIASLQITIDDKDELSVMNVFQKVTISKDKSRRNSVRITMDDEQANTLFNFTRYSVYLKDVTNNAKSVHTSRLYMLLSTEKFRGEWTVSYQRLRDIFGYNFYGTAKEKEVIKTTEDNLKSVKYKEYKDFRKRVLESAKNELRLLAEEGLSDFYFSYEEIYAEGVKPSLRNDPDKIKFVIHNSIRGELEDQRRKDVTASIELEKTLKSMFGLKDNECRQITKLCKGIDIEKLKKKLTVLKKTVDNKNNIVNFNAYIMQSLRSIIIELTPVAEEVTQVPEQPAHESQPVSVDAESSSKFSAMLDGIEPAWRTAIRLNAVKSDSIVLMMDSRTAYDTFCKLADGKTFFRNVEKEFGKKVKIKFGE